MLKTRERIITTDDLVQDIQTALANAQREPLVVTENGRPAAYLVSVELFDAMINQLELLEEAELITAIKKGEQQFTEGNYKTLTEAKILTEHA